MQKLTLLAWIFLFISMPLCVFCQDRTITGTVKNEKGEPVSLATVQQKGTKTGTTANQDGVFNINVKGKNVTLVVSSVGYQSREISVGTETSYNIELTEAGNLSEVVVTALGISRDKKALGYATQEVKAANLNENHQSNLVNALQGKWQEPQFRVLVEVRAREPAFASGELILLM